MAPGPQNWILEAVPNCYNSLLALYIHFALLGSGGSRTLLGEPGWPGWLPRWLSGWPGWLAAWLAGCLAGWPAGWVPGWPGCLAGVAAWPAGPRTELWRVFQTHTILYMLAIYTFQFRALSGWRGWMSIERPVYVCRDEEMGGRIHSLCMPLLGFGSVGPKFHEM